MLLSRARWVVVAAAALLLTACAEGSEPAVDEDEPQTQAEFWASYDDWREAYVECARAHGIDASINEQGAIENPVSPDRPVVGGLDAGCLEEVGPEPQAPPASEALLIGMYELFQDQVVCLEGHGYVISDPPPRDEWVETYGADSWNPLGDVVAATGSVIPAISQCPEPDPVEAEALGFEILGEAE